METARSFANTEADRLRQQQRRVPEVQAPGPLPPHGPCCWWDQWALLWGQVLPICRREGKARAMLLASAEHGRLGDCCHYHVQYRRLPSMWGSKGWSGQNWCIIPATIRLSCKGHGCSCSSGGTAAGWNRKTPLHWQGSTYSYENNILYVMYIEYLILYSYNILGGALVLWPLTPWLI